MATQGGKAAGKRKVTAQVTLRGRYSPGTRVRLYRVGRPEALRHAEGDELLGVRKVDKDGMVRFTDADGVEVNGRYILYGHVAGHPLSLRLRGREPGDVAEGAENPPVGNAEVKHADGTVVGERGQPMAGTPREKPAVPEHPDPAGKDVQRASLPVIASQPNAEDFPEERPAVPPHPDPGGKDVQRVSGPAGSKEG
jgi:hypothetical protein